MLLAFHFSGARYYATRDITNTSSMPRLSSRWLGMALQKSYRRLLLMSLSEAARQKND